MFAISNNELADLPVLGKTVTCWICGQEHAVEYGETIGEDGKRQSDGILAFFKCGEHSYLCGVKGKQLKKPQENIQHLNEYNRPMPQKIDHAAVGREYANNLLGEPAVSKCLHAMADEIERLQRRGAFSGNADNVDFKDIAAAGRAYADNLLKEPAITEVMHRMADEIEQLREAIRRLAEQDATLSVCEGNVTVTMDATLTDAEREAVDMAIDLLNGVEDVSAGASSRADAAAATLRGLLERTA